METIKFSKIGKQDVQFGRSTFEVTLADGRVVSQDELNLDSFSDKILSEDDATTNGITNLLTLRHTTTGTPATGIGAGITFQAESADESPSDGMGLEVAFDDITAGSEDTTFWVKLRTAGAALGRRFGFVSTGAFQTLFTAAPTANRTLTIPDATDTLVTLAATQTLTNKTLTDSAHNAGAGSETFKPAGVINADTTAGLTTAVITEETLITYTLPASSLNTNGKAIRLRVAGQCAANTNTKTVRLYFGTTVLISNDITTAPNNQSWEFEATIIRTAATTQKCMSRGTVANVNQTSTYTGSGQTLTGNVVIKVTGQNGVATASDITAQFLHVEFLN